MTTGQALLERLASAVATHYVGDDRDEMGRRLAASTPPPEDAMAAAQTLTDVLRSLTADLHFAVIPSALVADYVERTDGDEVWLGDRYHNGGVRTVDLLPGQVAVVELAPLVASLTWSAEPLTGLGHLVAASRAAVLDLRECAGGDPAACARVVDLFLGASDGAEPRFEIRWADGTVDRHQRDTASTRRMPALAIDTPVFVVTSGRSASGAECIAAELRGAGRVTIVGERTAGAAHPVRFFTISDDLIVAVPAGVAVHPVTGDSWEGTGVAPDVHVPSDDALAVAVEAALAHVASLGLAVTSGEAARELERRRSSA